MTKWATVFNWHRKNGRDLSDAAFRADQWEKRKAISVKAADFIQTNDPFGDAFSPRDLDVLRGIDRAAMNMAEAVPECNCRHMGDCDGSCAQPETSDPLRSAVADYMKDTQTLPLEECAKLFSLRLKALISSADLQREISETDYGSPFDRA